MSESQATRANRDGHPCPAWCDVDHGQAGACVGSGASIDHIWTRAVRGRDDSYIHLGASLPDPAADWPSLNLDLREAEYMAVILGLLADATPDQHRKLAAGIRQAAADITDGGTQ